MRVQAVRPRLAEHPRHTPKGRQSAAEVERIGLRLRLRKQQAEAGDIVLLYCPKPGQPIKPVVLVEDNGPIHTIKLSLAAITGRLH